MRARVSPGVSTDARRGARERHCEQQRGARLRRLGRAVRRVVVPLAVPGAPEDAGGQVRLRGIGTARLAPVL